ncbi:hypothetical protein ACEWY4_008845 [Coilia grayii]|uniref:G-protein coupled receptors family 1 profile domain-containing protein n=1 Tax=Coilia grayii TaxID=363190 RepID=A0ABD1KBZ5_9TELE
MGDSENQTFYSVLRMARLDIPLSAVYPTFVIGFLVYLFSVFSNVVILLLIVTQRRLHRPMFYIFFSLPLQDLIGISAMFPRVLVDIVGNKHTVSYPACVFQAFLLHMYGGGIKFILVMMALDRYIAICKPLKYNTIMTPVTVGTMISLAWGVDFALILVLFLLQARVKQCKDFIMNVYCDNVSLLRLSCGEDLTVNNIYGLAITAFINVTTVSIQLFSYIHILVTCLKNKHSDAKAKALNTCLAQIISSVLFQVVGLFTIISYRLPNASANSKNACGMMIFLILPVLNPIIYGMKAKDIRTAFFQVLKKGKVTWL